MSQHGKRYSAARGAIDRERVYSPAEAVRMLKAADSAKFDETVEVHLTSASTCATPTSSCAAR